MASLRALSLSSRRCNSGSSAPAGAVAGVTETISAAPAGGSGEAVVAAGKAPGAAGAVGA